MVRRTKEEALATRHRLLDAAEHVFSEKGVSRTCLQDIAQAAGATRGAIYWHFKNKADLFNAMMARTTLPMEEVLHQIGDDVEQDSLDGLRGAIAGMMQNIASDERTRRVFEVAFLKVEYVDDLLEVKARQLQIQEQVVCQMARTLQACSERRALPLRLSPQVAAQGLHALVVGLIHIWLLAPEAFDLAQVTQETVDTYLAGLGLA